ncbi:phospholipid-transporting ATPase 2 [Triticum aestivum]|uniref:phospholipid-transporting ATPase 2 n=1 Tax=Triticum aestivum TaxID=4565 RepID=UPI001D019285|nr:phospholipid-transporting ATPase 2-like [Triticum aestivum]
MAYNAFYTSIPVLTTALDKDLSEKTVAQNPEILLYCQAFNPSTFAGWFGRLLYHAIVIFLITTHAYADEKGETEELSMVALSGSTLLQASVCCDIRDEFFHFSAVSAKWGNFAAFHIINFCIGSSAPYQLLGCTLSCTAFVDSRHTG